MTFDPTKPVQTRDGRKVRILCINGNCAMPIVAFILETKGTMADKEVLASFYPNGRWMQTREQSCDLVNVPNRHKHADVIIAWANGAEIEVFRPTRITTNAEYKNSIRDKWVKDELPMWIEEYEYRVKP